MTREELGNRISANIASATIGCTNIEITSAIMKDVDAYYARSSERAGDSPDWLEEKLVDHEYAKGAARAWRRRALEQQQQRNEAEAMLDAFGKVAPQQYEREIAAKNALLNECIRENTALASALEDARAFMAEMLARHGDSGVGILIRAADKALHPLVPTDGSK